MVHVVLDGVMRTSLPISSLLPACPCTPLSSSSTAGRRLAEEKEEELEASEAGAGCQLTVPARHLIADTTSAGQHVAVLLFQGPGWQECDGSPLYLEIPLLVVPK